MTKALSRKSLSEHLSSFMKMDDEAVLASASLSFNWDSHASSADQLRLGLAILVDDPAATELVLQRSPDLINDTLPECLVVSEIFTGQIEGVEFFDDMSPLMLAASIGSFRAGEVLLAQEGLDIDQMSDEETDSWTALALAAIYVTQSQAFSSRPDPGEACAFMGKILQAGADPLLIDDHGNCVFSILFRKVTFRGAMSECFSGTFRAGFLAMETFLKEIHPATLDVLAEGAHWPDIRDDFEYFFSQVQRGAFLARTQPEDLLWLEEKVGLGPASPEILVLAFLFGQGVTSPSFVATVEREMPQVKAFVERRHLEESLALSGAAPTPVTSPPRIRI
jgi:hypothetical protein